MLFHSPCVSVAFVFQGRTAPLEVPREDFPDWLLKFQEEAGVELVLQRPGSRQEVEEFCTAAPGEAPCYHSMVSIPYQHLSGLEVLVLMQVPKQTAPRAGASGCSSRPCLAAGMQPRLHHRTSLPNQSLPPSWAAHGS